MIVSLYCTMLAFIVFCTFLFTRNEVCSCIHLKCLRILCWVLEVGPSGSLSRGWATCPLEDGLVLRRFRPGCGLGEDLQLRLLQPYDALENSVENLMQFASHARYYFLPLEPCSRSSRPEPAATAEPAPEPTPHACAGQSRTLEISLQPVLRSQFLQIISGLARGPALLVRGTRCARFKLTCLARAESTRSAGTAKTSTRWVGE